MSNPITDGARKAGEFASDKFHAAKDATEAALETAKATMADAYEASRVKAGKAAETAKKTARAAKVRTAREVEDNPLAFLVGGMALGALAGALLPRTQREEKVLGPTGRKINQRARAAADAAKQAGQKKLEKSGVSKVAAKQQLGKIVGSIALAAEEASSAATKAVAKPVAKQRAKR